MAPAFVAQPVAEAENGSAEAEHRSAEAEHRRYRRQVVLPQIGRSGQRRLTGARVAVVGAGGLGSPALLYLAAAGVGTLAVIDDDLVEESNLQRQVLHRQEDVGRPKADSARDAILRLNPLVTVVAQRCRLGPDNGRDLLAGHDVVLDGSDNFATRYLVNDLCAGLGVPCVWGSVTGFGGQASVAWPPHGACYRCLYPPSTAGEQTSHDAGSAGEATGCDTGGVIGVACAAVGTVMATETIKILLGLGELLTGHLLVYDALAVVPRVLRVPRDPDCRTCGVRPEDGGRAPLPAPVQVGASVPTVDAADLPALTAQGAVIVDLREPDETGPALPGARCIPISSFLDLDRDVDPRELLPADRPVVLCCGTGARSLVLAGRLLEAGFRDVRSLRGGLAARQGQS